jgi:hypothetical protein
MEAIENLQHYKAGCKYKNTPALLHKSFQIQVHI